MTSTKDFLALLDDHYAAYARDLPWRLPEADGRFSAYKILVSEMMLQQTQVPRVMPKYQAFVIRFPDARSLAESSLADVLAAWNGLGYNRRARYLWEAAQTFAGAGQPWEYDMLVACKGIGPNTPAAVQAYCYDLPVLFLETNIKTVLLYHFFEGKNDVSDKELLAALERVVPWRNAAETSPRQFYWSLMDYGTHLKATIGNQSHRSRSFTRQSRFEGSRRQLRGRLIRRLLEGPQELERLTLEMNDPRLDDVIGGLTRDGLVLVQGKTLMLYNRGNSH